MYVIFFVRWYLKNEWLGFDELDLNRRASFELKTDYILALIQK